MISDADAVPSTPMELVSRLTEHDVTPGTLDTAFSTRLLHAAQLIPVTRYCSIFSPSCSIFRFLFFLPVSVLPSGSCSSFRFLLYFPDAVRQSLFHQFLQCCNQFIHGCIFSLSYIIRHAGTNMVCKKYFIKTVQRRIHS